MGSGTTIATCGGNGEPDGVVTLTFVHHTRADVLLWHTTNGLPEWKAKLLDSFVEHMRVMLAEGIYHITGDEYHLHTDHPPAP